MNIKSNHTASAEIPIPDEVQAYIDDETGVLYLDAYSEKSRNDAAQKIHAFVQAARNATK